VQTQQHVLPDCEWQHITFIMPDKLWEIFRYNRPLLGKLFNCAAQILISGRRQKDWRSVFSVRSILTVAGLTGIPIFTSL
jgi:hypothetical protein